MKKALYLSTLIPFLCVLHSAAQSHKTSDSVLIPPDKKIEIVGDPITAKGAFFIGEVHDIFEGQKFEFDIARMVHKDYNISKLVLEIGQSDAYLFNAYFQNGDTALLSFYGRSKEVMDRLKPWQQLYDDCKFTIYGIDFERFSFITAVLSIMNKNELSKTTELYKYMSGLSALIGTTDDDVSDRKQRVKIYSKARGIFESEKPSLKTTLTTGYTTIAGIFENPAMEKNMRKRDEAMALNLTKLRDTGFICIMGLGHTDLHHNSLLKRYISDSLHQHNTTLISMVCKNCFNSSYYAAMTIPMTSDYKGKNEDYMGAVFDTYYKPGFYSLVNQLTFKDLPSGYNNIPTYYVFFKDQPKW